MSNKVITVEALQQFAELQKEYIDSVAKTGGNFSGSADIKIDAGLSTNSENPVQNKVITNKINEISLSLKKNIYKATTSGAVSINGANYDIAIITLNGNVTNVTLSSIPIEVKEIACIFYGNGTERIVAVANSDIYRTNTGDSLEIVVPANGYAEVNFLYDGTNIWIRGV